MENQHRKIKGYRELTQDEIDLMNEIKTKGAELEALIAKVAAVTTPASASHEDMKIAGQAMRWLSIGQTHMQEGLMALTRAVAKPEFF